MLKDYIRKSCCKKIAGTPNLSFSNAPIEIEELKNKFQGIDSIGLYLHIPFCEQICPYCPYNREIYSQPTAAKYVEAMKRELDVYASLLGQVPITSFYIGGGTPTTLLHSGLEDVLKYIESVFNVQCDIHMESHPNHLSDENLSYIESLHIKHLSIGVEALQDRHLRYLHRPYSAKEIVKVIERVKQHNFTCVNLDFIFALPNQTDKEIEEAGRMLVDSGVDQVAAYPLFRFPYTSFGKLGRNNKKGLSTLLRRRRMLKILEGIFYSSGFERTSVWAFTRKGTPRYCSVTVPRYIGIGASGGTYLDDIFYVNTFKVDDYIQAMNNGNLPTALQLPLTEKMQMAGWLYWRIYETRFKKSDFAHRFNKDINAVYGKYLNILSTIGFSNNGKDDFQLTDKGAYWLHAFEDLFSINYITKLWGTSKESPWPGEVVL